MPRRTKSSCVTHARAHDTHMAILIHVLYVVCFPLLDFVYVYGLSCTIVCPIFPPPLPFAPTPFHPPSPQLISMLAVLWVTHPVFRQLSASELTFTRRVMYARCFKALTSSQKAQRLGLPHFSLKNTQNIKFWLALRCATPSQLRWHTKSVYAHHLPMMAVRQREL